MKPLTFSKISALGFGILFVALANTSANSVTPSSVPADSPPVRFTVALGTEMMAGDTTYQIGDPSTSPSGVTENEYFPFSELQWPLDIWLGKLEGSLLIKDMVRINATLKKNITEPSDNMADSDWLTINNPNRLDVYSESEISSFDALIFDVDFEWIFLQGEVASLYAGVGLLYQNFDYESELLYQYSPSGMSGWNYEGTGEVSITYEMTYTIPYVKIGGEFQVIPQLNLAGSFAFSPIVNAEDTDRHLLRENGGKISTGDMDGNAFMFDMSAQYKFTQGLFVKAGLQYVRIDVDGTQSQAFGDGTPGYTVTEESESSQTSGFIVIGYAF